MSKKIGRNDKCPCGSGKKYKKCCINSGRRFNTTQAQAEPPSIFSQYNSVDLIKTFAGLTLLPQNHGKNVRLEVLTRKAAQNFNEQNTIPETELQAYLGEHYAMHYLEDPATNLFTDLITFYDGDFIIFPGITDGGSYVLTYLLTAIYNWPESGIPEQFRSNCAHVSRLMLNLSNNIAQSLGYQRYTKDQVENNAIHFPTSVQLNRLKNAIVFSEDEMQQLLLEEQIAPQALDCFILDRNDRALQTEHMQDSPLLKQPIIHHNQEYIIASPATLSYALTEWILTEATAAGCQEQVSQAYHNTIWNYTQLHLGQLGFSRVEVSTIPETNDPNIREAIYRFDDDKLAFVQYVSEGTDHQERKQHIINNTLALSEFTGYKFMDITLVSSMGRELFFMFSRTENSKSIGMPIHDFDTLIKLKEHTAFDLWKYATAWEEKLGDNPPMGASFLDVFKVYKEKEDSFYISDDAAQVMLHVEPGYAEDLYQGAKLLTDEHSALRSMEGGRLANIPVERKDKYSPIYYSKSDLENELQFLVIGYHQPVWVSPIKDVNTIHEVARGLYFEMNDAIAYWLWQCQEHIKDEVAILGVAPLTVKFEFDQEERFHPIERNFDRDPDFTNHFTVSAANNEISISIPPSIIPYLYGADNEGERVLLRQLINGFNQLLTSNEQANITENRIDEIIDEVAPLGAKKKVFILDTADNLLLDPSNLDKHRYIQDYDVNVVLDSIVPGLGDLCPETGDIMEKADKTTLTRNIVMRFLLPKLQTTISQYDNEVLLKRLISLNESLIRKREDLRIKTPTRIACFVSVREQTEDLQDSLSILNQTTIAVRCLIEHLAAEPSTGNKIVSTAAIDELIAIMSAIIDWGSLGDQIEFDLFDIEMGILPSGRVGTSKKLIKEIFDPYHSSKSKENVQNALDTFEQAFPQLNPVEGKDVPENLDKAYMEEFGISFTRICEFINDLGIIAYQQPAACASLSKSDLFVQINQQDHVFTQEEFDHAMNYLCLVNRGKVHKIPEGFDGIDISPWRFNRRLSLLRKPLVVVDDPKAPDNPTIYWGFRQLLTSKMYLFDQCTTNRLRVTEDGPVQKVLGKLAQQNGSGLVQSVLEEVGSDELIIDSEVPINRKSALKHDKNIGDVDVLVIDATEKVVYSLECKSMAPSRNIKEMVEEVGKLFGSDSKKGWIEKHVERDVWLNSNLDLLGAKYKLDLSGFTVRSFFITQEDMLTPYLTTKKAALPFVTLYNLRENGINALT
ncbi:YecA family protein [Lutimonas zeaxanthinifaciens]|uniref:YecA family protein n=1 Tax=Lutimonas zeaxanthinifaciens TaxID=3060215 RepID=UPI00265C8F25|nr:SEC-C metal-binding domain-containing protein [Lutimonas sp. YSD2104]WKK66522.1 SEC-C metal-binding domain-containing protein [Lutimonas sp. YSD2104]